MKRILIIEDEHHLLESMVKFMETMDDVRVTGCAKLSEAVEYLKNTKPHLVFSDINLPDGTGLELIGLLSAKGISPPLVFVSAYIADYRDRIPRDSNIMVLEKPVSMNRLRDIARQKLFEDTGEYAFKLADYIQIACMGKHSVCLDWRDYGKIMIVDGQAWSAFDLDGDGETAFKRLAVMSQQLVGGDEILCRRITPDEAGEQNLFGSLDNLLLNAIWEDEERKKAKLQAKQPDEDDASLETLLDVADATAEDRVATAATAEPSTVSEPVATISAETESFADLIDQGMMLALRKQYSEAVGVFKRAKRLEPDDKLLNLNLERLKKMGFE